MPSNSSPKSVLLRGHPAFRVGKANAALTPGHLIEQMSTGNYRKHATAGQHTQALIAREEEYTGGDLDTAYASNDHLPFYAAKPGDQFYMIVAAGAAAIAIGDYLESAGDGTLRKRVALVDNSGGTADGTIADVPGSYTEATEANNLADIAAFVNASRSSAIARALEALDNSGSSDAARLRVEII